ncbi:hypothetical protein PAHAL_9G629000 [Panicum hallii]|uniref:Uncharacterized protein n=1 Tax=Panicum hallii TaxID=206008 RepID=A0A2T8I6N0_9POAL|nr:hypothetical protein PAHAL_9G629000 [Panicum hallii]
MGIGAASHHIGFLSAARFRAHALFDLAARFSRPPGAQPPRGESNLPLMAPHFIQRRSQGPRFQHPCSVRWHDAYQTERGSHNVTANRLMAPIRTGMLVPPITPSFHPVDLTVQG